MHVHSSVMHACAQLRDACTTCWPAQRLVHVHSSVMHTGWPYYYTIFISLAYLPTDLLAGLDYTIFISLAYLLTDLLTD